MTYYTAIVICNLISLVVLYVLVYENDRLDSRDKLSFYLTCVLISLSVLSEWAGIQLNGRTDINILLLRIVKCCDYIFTPIAGAAIVLQLHSHNAVAKVLYGSIIVNTVFQVISFFTGWMTVIGPDNRYSHGKLYAVYVVLYLVTVVLAIAQFAIFGKSYRKHNLTSLYLILLLILVGIVLQEVFGGEIRTSYLTLTIGVAFMFIHTTEYSQMKTDEKMEQQTVLITTDALTGLKSRHAYSQALDRLNARMPGDMAVVSIDINGLKETNDALGHDAGDELIKGAASCIEKVFGKSAYRTGGDEFIVLTQTDKAQVKRSVTELQNHAAQWHGKVVKELHLAIGYALAQDERGADCEELIRMADKMMYADKDAFYEKTGSSRRSR